jgi:erythromycin esterase-like protein
MADTTSARSLALPLVTESDLDQLMDRIGDARYVLIGEASHGTHEYYAWRAALTKRLITGSVDVPDDPKTVLRGFDRWPAWMWANTDVVDFTRWLRSHNERLTGDRKSGSTGWMSTVCGIRCGRPWTT